VGLLFGDAHFAGVEQIERGLDGVAHRALGCQADFVALFEGIVDGFREVGVSHAGSPGQWRPLVGAGAGRVKGHPWSFRDRYPMEPRPVSYLTEASSRLLAILPGAPALPALGRQTERAVTLRRTDEIKRVAINMSKRRK